MSTNIVLNEKDSLIAHYFPNERIPNGCRAGFEIIDYPGYDSSIDKLEEYCKKVWKWEALWWNRSRFIFKYGCIAQ